jgi:O-antigen/teichoic acid export membrane protein
LTIFFSYAHLGFLSACVKYAAEYFIRGERKEEMKVIGFTAFIMICAFSILALVMLILGIYPRIVIPELIAGSESYRIAQWLLITLALSCPIIIGQRILSVIFTIRVQDYVFQRFLIIGNILRILSVFFFFGSGRYMLVEYYIFYQFINLLVVLLALVYTRKYDYNIIDFLRYFHFDRKIFDKVKAISGTSLVMTVSMIIYYELDQIFISNILGLEAVAIYGVALSVLAWVRQFNSIVYSPYTSRFNHFVGMKDFDGLLNFVSNMILIFTPIVVLPILGLSLFSEPFLMSWLGEKYVESAILVSLLVLSFTPNCIKDPISSYFVATENNRVLIKYNILVPVIYWLGIFFTFKYWGLVSFAVFKTIAPYVNTIGYWSLIKKEFIKHQHQFVRFSTVVCTIVVPIVFLLGYRYVMGTFVDYTHSKLALMNNILIIGTGIVISLLISLCFDKVLKGMVTNYLHAILLKFK